ncbi:MAG: two pore domain potassium channel family protein [Rhodothermales bacterium]|nr:two pore domain potassium channel family protein [Rhodothermales bacterium]MBO6779265.1 two pore domain potassium channel family protein [Rhodothermales bacterium]
MTAAFLLSMVLVCATTYLHTNLVMRRVPAWWKDDHRPLTVMLGVSAIVLVHVVEAGLYAAGFYAGSAMGLGSFVQEAGMGPSDYFYFSLVTYNTLGLGDMHPTGALRMLAGVGAINGFLLISCSASVVFRHMWTPTSGSQ